MKSISERLHGVKYSSNLVSKEKIQNSLWVLFSPSSSLRRTFLRAKFSVSFSVLLQFSFRATVVLRL